MPEKTPPKKCLLVGLFVGLAAACGSVRLSLVERVGESEKDYGDGRYAIFVEERADRGAVDAGGDRRPALTPPFPARLRFEVDVPRSGHLTFAPALVTEQRVSRARVEFAVSVETGGRAVEVFSELFLHTDANRWQEREVDLTEWAGERVVLELETREAEGRTDMLWADRVQAVWGNPVVASSYGRELDVVAGEASEWLAQQTEDAGVSLEEVASLRVFAVNLLLGGLLSLGIREVYRRFGSTQSGRDQFGNLFPLFTTITIVVIAVVRSSLALSLGLIGALSIVRFRSAIKSPEELAYLLFCASVGIALGAEQRLIAVTSVVLVCVFVIVRQSLGPAALERNLLLTVSGDAQRFYEPGRPAVLDRLESIARRLRLQRLDHDGEQVELRAIVSVAGDDAGRFLLRLREQLPELQFSCVDVDDVL